MSPSGSSPQPGKILVVRGGAIGDFVLTLPVLSALRSKFPDASLEILGYPAIASLAVAGGLATCVTPLESPMFTGFFVEGGTLADAARDFFARFDLIVSFTYDPDRIFQRNIERCTNAAFICGPHRPRETDDIHAAVALLHALRRLGPCGGDAQPRLAIPRSKPAFSGTWLAVHPGSGSTSKNWPEAKWARLLPLIAAQTAFSFLLIGGEAEEDRCACLASLLPASRVRVAQNLPLPELARLMQDCAFFIGHDSGITHLAAALDLPGMALWGPSNPGIWSPVSGKFSTMSMGPDGLGLETLPVEVVLKQVLNLLTRLNLRQ